MPRKLVPQSLWLAPLLLAAMLLALGSSPAARAEKTPADLTYEAQVERIGTLRFTFNSDQTGVLSVGAPAESSTLALLGR